MTHTKNIHGNGNLRPLSSVRQNYVASIDRATYEKSAKETEQNGEKNSH
jgi:hypothetical protein